jgi:hexokinase
MKMNITVYFIIVDLYCRNSRSRVFVIYFNNHLYAYKKTEKAEQFRQQIGWGLKFSFACCQRAEC